MNSEMLLIAALGLPAIMLVACLFARLRKTMPTWLCLAPVPALAAGLFAPWNSPVVLSGPPYHVTLVLDASSSMLLIAASLLWIAAGFYVPAFFRGRSIGGSFTVCWLLTLAGSLGIFLAADLVGFLLFYALVSLPAYGLVTYDGTPVARRAGVIYMGFALLGENLLLMSFVLLAFNSPEGGLRIVDVVASIPAAPFRNIILSLLIAAFGMKIALLPMHFWMPLSYTAAPIPAAAVLSGAAVKAGVIGLIRFLPFDMALPGWGEFLAIIGLCGAFFGVAVGITHSDPKTVLAYSSISQMGFLAAVLGMGLSAGDAGAALIAALYAAHHVLVKGALFLAVGVGHGGSESSRYRAGAGSDYRTRPGWAAAHRGGLGQVGGESSARLWLRGNPCDLVSSRNRTVNAAFPSSRRLHDESGTWQDGASQACRDLAGDGLLLCRRSLDGLSNRRAWIAFGRRRPKHDFENALAGADRRGIVRCSSTLAGPAPKHSKRRYCRLGRRSVARRGGVRSGYRQARRHPEVMDGCLSGASRDRRSATSGDASRKLKIPAIGVILLKWSAMLVASGERTRPRVPFPAAPPAELVIPSRGNSVR